MNRSTRRANKPPNISTRSARLCGQPLSPVDDLLAYQIPSLVKHFKFSKMAYQSRLVMLISIVSFFFSYASAASFWYAFWMTYPDDNLVWNTPGDQPNTNYELHRALIDDSSSATVYASRTNAIGEKGSTWWVMAKLDEAVYQQKYDALDLVRKPEDNSCVTLSMLMAYTGQSRKHPPPARGCFQRQGVSVIIHGRRGCCIATCSRTSTGSPGPKRQHGMVVTA